MGIRPGQSWGEPLDPGGPTPVAVSGDDRDLAGAVAAAPAGTLFRFEPSPESDVARGIGLDGRSARGTVLTLDALALGGGSVATNAVIMGSPPDRIHALSRRFAVTVTVDGRTVFRGRATTVVVATGEFLRGRDLSPRGHPGDGRAEVQIYALPAGERRASRRRLRAGTHLPHARIIQATGRRIGLEARRPRPLEVDGFASAPAATLAVEVVPGAFRVLV
ncbi:MAG: hypothetical protein ACKO1Y_05400 [Actinomycetota bacterium]